MKYDREDAQAAIRAALRAFSRVRDGRWIRGAPSHVLADFLTELQRDGWVLRRQVENDGRLALNAMNLRALLRLLPEGGMPTVHAKLTVALGQQEREEAESQGLGVDPNQ